ncbi:MAG: OmpA family protein [Flammeovirgaceae bacterium]|nr:OmpA family protein [Flammeovirgaceae bacterium]
MRANRIFLLLALFPFFTAAQQSEELRKSIYFGGGSYYIDDLQISELADWLDSIPNLTEKYQIQLISHTDPIGGKEYNDWLSKMRSQAVYDIILAKDIPESIVHIKDWGLENAVYSNQSYRGRMMNRRVDVLLHPIVFRTNTMSDLGQQFSLPDGFHSKLNQNQRNNWNWAIGTIIG